jgi:hypothetical protein
VPVNNGLAIRRERRFDVVTRPRDDVAATGAVRFHHAHPSEIHVVPGGVDDPLPVARERRKELVDVFALRRSRRQPLRFAGGKRTAIEMPEGAEDHERAIGRDLDVAQHLDRKLRRVDGTGHAHGRVERLLHVRLEWNGVSFPARRVNAPELPSPQITMDLPSGVHAYCG